jgi:hypothetical protein
MLHREPRHHLENGGGEVGIDGMHGDAGVVSSMSLAEVVRARKFQPRGKTFSCSFLMISIA